MSLTLFITLLLLIFSTTGTSGSPEGLIPSLKSRNLKSVHLPSPNPELISLFSETNISLLLSIPNSLIPSFSSNPSAVSAWLSTYVSPFVPHVRISAISVGDNVTDANLLKLLIPAIHNVKEKFEELGFERVKVSTTISSGFNVGKELWCGLREINVTSLFVKVKLSLRFATMVVPGEFALKRDLSSRDTSYYESLGDGDYIVVEVEVLKAEVKKKDRDRNKARLLLVSLVLGIIFMFKFCLELFDSEGFGML